MAKIVDYPITKTLSKSDVLLVDGVAGTRTINAEDAAKVFETFITKVSKSYIDKTFANAIKETLVGTSVSANMVSPVEHEVGCKVYSENLVPFPFREKPVNYKGVAFQYDNGVITANGTATETIYIGLLPNEFKMGEGNYAISGCPKIKGCLIQAQYDGKWGKHDNGNGVSFEVQQELTGLLVQINAGTTVTNAVFKPKLQLGTLVTPYTPYVKDLSGITVTQNPGNKTFITGEGGIITGMKSTYPEMTVETAATNVVMKVTYNVDTKKYIDKRFMELENSQSLMLDLSGYSDASMQMALYTPWTITLSSEEYAVLDKHIKNHNHLSIKDKDNIVFECTATENSAVGAALLVNSFLPAQNIQAVGVMSYNKAAHTLQCQGYSFAMTPAQ